MVPLSVRCHGPACLPCSTRSLCLSVLPLYNLHMTVLALPHPLLPAAYKAETREKAKKKSGGGSEPASAGRKRKSVGGGKAEEAGGCAQQWGGRHRCLRCSF